MKRMTLAQGLALALLVGSLAAPSCTSKPDADHAPQQGWASPGVGMSLPAGQDPTPPPANVTNPVGTGVGHDPVKMTGSIRMILKDRRGMIKAHRDIHNLVVSAGSAGVASRINGAGAEAAFTWIAIGIGTTSPVAGNTTCESEIVTGGGQRANGTATRVTTDVTNDTAQVDVTYTFTSSFAVTESCLLNASSAGTLLSRQTFSAINVVNTDSLLIRWKIDVD